MTMTSEERNILKNLEELKESLKKIEGQLALLIEEKEESAGSERTQKEILIEKYLDKYCIPKHICGYDYIFDSIMICIENIEVRMASELYPQVAEKNGITVTRVERGIRSAISEGVLRMDETTKVLCNSGKNITNSRFIKCIAREIRNKIGYTGKIRAVPSNTYCK